MMLRLVELIKTKRTARFTMNVVWEGVKATAGIVGQAAVETGMKGKLQTELLLIKREVENRKRAFGEELYTYVVRLSDTSVAL